MKDKYKIEIELKGKNDFCESDLEEAIKDGIENVGNYELKNIKITKIK